MPELNANDVDPDQMLQSATSGMGLHCLPMSLAFDLFLYRPTTVGRSSD